MNSLVSRNAVATDDQGAVFAYGDLDVVHRADVSDPENAVLYVGEHLGVVDRIAFSAGGAHVFTRASGGEACVWMGREQPLERGSSFMGARMTTTFGAANRGSLLKRLDQLGHIDTLATHPTDPERFLITRRGTVSECHLGFVSRPLARWRPTSRGLRAATWVPDGRRIVCGTDDGFFGVLSLDEARSVAEIASFGAAVGDVAVSADGTLAAAVTEDGRISVHVLSDGQAIAAWRLGTLPFAVAFADNDGGRLAIGCHDGIVRLWDWRDDASMRRLGACEGPALTLAVTADARVLVAGSEAGDIAAWDLAEEVQLWSTQDQGRSPGRDAGAVQAVAVSTDGSLALAGMMFEAVWVLELSSGRELAWIPVPPSVPGKPEHVTAVGVCDDDRTAVAGLWDGTLCVLDLKAARELLRFHAHTKVITAAAQAPGTGRVLTASLDDDPANDGACVWELLDVDTLPAPDPGVAGWPRAIRAAVEHRIGVGRAEATAAPPPAEVDSSQVAALRAAES